MTTTPQTEAQTEAQRLAALISATLDIQDDSYLTCSVTKCLLQQAAAELRRLDALGIEIEAPGEFDMSNEHNNAPAVPDGLQWFTVAEHGIPEIGAEVIGGLWYTDPWIKTELATTFMWGQCRVVESKHRDFKDGKQWCTFGPSHNQITHWARINTPGQTSAPAPAVPQGWRFKRNADDSIGIFAPPPKPGESQRTSHAVYPGQNRDLHELLGKLADQQATTPAPVVAGTRIESGVMIMKDGKAWGVAYSDGQTTAYGWVTPEQATIHDPKHLVKPTDATRQGSGYADELRKGKIVHVERRTQVIVKEQP